MATQFADAVSIDSGTIQETARRPNPGCDNDSAANDDRLTAARGILTGALIATPFWALIAFTIYMLQ